MVAKNWPNEVLKNRPGAESRKKLTDESNHGELDFTNRGNDNTEDDEGNISEQAELHRRNAHGPSSKQRSHRVGSLIKLAAVLHTESKLFTLSIWMKDTLR